MKCIFILTLLFNVSILYAGPQWDGSNIRFNEYPVNIVQNEYDFIFSPDSLSHNIERNINFVNISHDLFILKRDNRLNHAKHTRSTICINISIDKSKEILLLPLYDISIFEYSIEYLNNQIEIFPTALAYYNNTFYDKKIVFIFDDLLLKHSMIINIENNEIFEKYNYIYDNNKRLINIIAETNNNSRIIRKSIFYDGILRNIPRPYFDNLIIPNTDEIIIFFESTIKYHLRITRNFFDIRRLEFETLNEREEAWFYTLFEYNENGDEIIQSVFYNNGNVLRYYSNYSEYDNKNNWLRRIITNESNAIMGEVHRNIEYY